MKQFFTTFFTFLLFNSFLFAQISINADDIAPIGVVAEQTIDAEPDASIKPGDTGMQSWDFSALEDGEAGSFIFQEPQNTPYFDLFNASNLAALLDSNTYFYMNKSDDRIEVIGIFGEFEYQGVALDVAIDIIPGQSLIRFPATLGDSYTEEVDQIIVVPGSAIGAPFDSIKTENHLIRDVNIDAYGQMTTPAGVYETIRSSEREIGTTQVFVYDNGWQLADPGSPDTTLTYNWWTNENNLGFPVVQLEHSLNDGKMEATWLKEFIVDTDEARLYEVSLHPNPASEWLRVELQETFNGHFEIIDFNGRQVLRGSAEGQILNIGIAGLHTGHHLLVLKNKEGKLMGFKRFAVHH